MIFKINIVIITILSLIATLLIISCESKATRISSSFYMRRSAKKYKVVLSFPASCSGFSFGLVQAYTPCPVSRDDTQILYICEADTVYIIVENGAVCFTAEVNGLNANVDSTAIQVKSEFSGVSGFFQKLSEGSGITCGTNFCSSNKFVTECTPILKTNLLGKAYLYYTESGAPSFPGCFDSSTCCPATYFSCSTCPVVNFIGAPFINSGTVPSKVIGNTLEFSTSGAIKRIFFSQASVAGVPTIEARIWDVNNGILLGTAYFQVGTSSVVVDPPIFVNPGKYIVTLVASNYETGPLAFPTNFVNVNTLQSYTANDVVKFVSRAVNDQYPPYEEDPVTSPALNLDIDFQPLSC